MARDVQKEIGDLVKNNKIVLFMKGEPRFPQCGFSGKAVSLLKVNGVDIDKLTYVNVLADEEIRSGIKEFSNWPTIPQLFINGEFQGGADIMTEMHNSGELAKALT